MLVDSKKEFHIIHLIRKVSFFQEEEKYETRKKNERKIKELRKKNYFVKRNECE